MNLNMLTEDKTFLHVYVYVSVSKDIQGFNLHKDIHIKFYKK